MYVCEVQAACVPHDGFISSCMQEKRLSCLLVLCRRTRLHMHACTTARRTPADRRPAGCMRVLQAAQQQRWLMMVVVWPW
jgi:hypothetical protein